MELLEGTSTVRIDNLPVTPNTTADSPRNGVDVHHDDDNRARIRRIINRRRQLRILQNVW